MSPWSDRTIEERALLNPAFCSLLLWNFASAGGVQGARALTFSEAYLVLPIVLPKVSRESLPRSTRTSVAAWIDENPTFQTSLAVRCRAMVPFTKDALIFGGTRKLFQVSADSIRANEELRRNANATLRRASAETQACFKKAAFLGAWFIETGSPNTVMALLGIRP